MECRIKRLIKVMHPFSEEAAKIIKPNGRLPDAIQIRVAQAVLDTWRIGRWN